MKKKVMIKDLTSLKEKMKKGEMSVLVGAGFSKNVNKDIFPSWWELLFDLTYDLYKYEIEKELSNSPEKDEKKKEKLKEQLIDRYINRDGYLNIVSKYIEKKGYREAITTYIEERTPRVVIKNGKRVLSKKSNGKQVEVPLLRENLSVHRMLLNLNWNNIYTTNYDTMLEQAYENEGVEKLNSFKYSQIKQVNDIKKEIIKIEKENLILKEEEKKKSTTFFKNGGIDLNKIDDDTSIYEKQASNNHKLFNLERQVTKISKELTEVDIAIHNSISVVKKSSDLSVKRNKNIIKLHGSLREEREDYGFDNDKQKQYIIAKEDYESYPKNHEAFTQLMRISLLQESFCLIGFSGDDPNFIEWIKWVRDILSNENSNKSQEAKIYLIDVRNSEDDEAQKLFYKNYKITKISLGNEAIIRFLKKETGLDISKNNIKERLEALFNFLNNGNYSVPKVFLEAKSLEKYHNSWSKVKVKYDDLDPEKVLKNYKAIIEADRNKPELVFEFNNYYTNNKQNDLIYFSFELLNKIKDKKSQKEFLEIVLIALKNRKIPIYLLYDKEEISELKSKLKEFNINESFEEILTLQKLIKLEDSFLDDIDEENEVKHLRILFHIFNFDFESAKKILNVWEPINSKLMIQKSGLLSFFTRKDGFEYLKNKRELFEDSTLPHQLYYYQYYNYFNPTFSFEKNNSDIIAKLKSFGFNDIIEILEQQVKSFREEKNKIEKYGKGRFTTSNQINLYSGSSNSIKSAQFLNVLIDFCFPLTSDIKSFFNKEKWYQVFIEIYERYPFPSLFYSLQYSDEQFIRRVAQDFIFSERLIEVVNIILPKLLKSYLNNTLPIFMKKSVLIFSSEILVAVKPEIWEPYIEKLLNEEVFTKFLFDSKNEEYDLICSAVNYINNPEFINKIIIKLLKEDSSIVINILYRIYNNQIVSSLKSNKKIEFFLNSKIEKLNENVSNLYFLINLNTFLSNEQKSKIINKINELDFNKIDDSNTWNILLYFSGKDKKLIEIIKKGILTNKNLFDTGFNEKGSLTLNRSLILLSGIRIKKQIEWTEKESIKIFKKIESEFYKIEEFVKRREDVNVRDILEEMYRFMYFEKNKLLNLENFTILKNKIRALFFKQRGYESIHQALTTKDNHSNIIFSLSELSYNLDLGIDKEGSMKSIKILINRILLAKPEGLEASIAFLISYVKENEEIKRDNFEDLIFILKRYYDDIPSNSDKVFIYKEMIKLAKSLKNDDNEIIKKWFGRYKEGRYNYSNI